MSINKRMLSFRQFRLFGGPPSRPTDKSSDMPEWQRRGTAAIAYQKDHPWAYADTNPQIERDRSRKKKQEAEMKRAREVKPKRKPELGNSDLPGYSVSKENRPGDYL